MGGSSKHGFTLIELLIVVAIIAILAAIAIPNLLEAQVRSKVAAVKSDLRIIAGALESYHVDNKVYPEDYASDVLAGFYGMGRLTTPIAYMSTVPRDVFGGYTDTQRVRNVKSYSLGTEPDEKPTRWMLTSAGPNRQDETSPTFGYPGFSADLWDRPQGPYRYLRYDPTNGTVSAGDIIRVSDGSL